MSADPHAQPFSHRPVMLDEVIRWFDPVPAGWLVDATLGGAGHATALLETYAHLKVLGLDRDPVARAASAARLAPFGDRALIRAARFGDFDTVVGESLGSETEIAGALFDLGVSSVQLDTADRGFSYRVDAPLDMRMGPDAPLTAAELINTLDKYELAELLRRFGDERFAGRIAAALVAARQVSPVTTTLRLSEIVTNAIPAATRRTGGHPAKRTFQALRIAVNDELAQLEPALDAAIARLAPQGRVVVLAYHSGEDRIVKDCFRRAESGGCTCPPGLPCTCGALPRGRAVRRGVTRPTEAEVAANPRAASALARVFEAGPHTSVSSRPMAVAGACSALLFSSVVPEALP